MAERGKIMSTKIYNGMVIPLNKLGEFTSLFHKVSIRKAQKDVKKLMETMSPEKSLKILKDFYVDEYDSFTLEYAVPTLLMCWMINASKTSENFSNYDMWFNAWIIKNKVYLYAPSDKLAPTHKNFPDWCKDFSYWDNMDPDSKVSKKAWNNRDKIWDYIWDEGEVQASRLTSVVIEGKESMNRGILELFPDIPKEKLYSLQMIAYWAKKKENKK